VNILGARRRWDSYSFQGLEDLGDGRLGLKLELVGIRRRNEKG